MVDDDVEPESEPTSLSGPQAPGAARDPYRLMTGIALVGVVITVVVTAALSLQEATDPTRSAEVPWAGVVILLAGVGGLVLLIVSRRK
jgi:hypothetical protein